MPECGGCHRIQLPVNNSAQLHDVLSNENVKQYLLCRHGSASPQNALSFSLFSVVRNLL